MKHGRQEKLRRAALFKRFVESNPPKMPKNFSHAAYKRMVNYAWVAFVTGYNTGENDVCRGRMLSPLSTTT